jgi:L-ascorbate oxidase
MAVLAAKCYRTCGTAFACLPVGVGVLYKGFYFNKIKEMIINRYLPIVALACLAMGPTAALGQADRRAVSPSAPPLATEASTEDKARDLIPSAGNNFSVERRKLEKLSGREADYLLPIQYTKGNIYNPSTDMWDAVLLRSYGRNPAPGNLFRPDFVAPTVLIKPGQTIRFNLSNRLPAQPDCESKTTGTGTINTPHCFNTTNMHTHGLWVSPAGNSDNVLLRIKPGVNFEYEYNVPFDHPAGTFWYHPHTHGSTAMQVGSGMAGALLIQGDREPTPNSNGDLDTLLRPFQPVGGIKNEVKLLQQIPYACFASGPDGKPKIETDPNNGTWTCKPGQIGVVESFNQQMAFGSWTTSGRHTLINGFARNPAQPLLLEVGKLHRWRLIDTGVQEPIALRISKIVNTAGMNNARYATRAQQNTEAQALCNDPKALKVSQFEVAADGLTRASVYEKTVNTLQPGYRSDILFVLPEKGYYCVFSDPKNPSEVTARNANVLTVIQAVGNQIIPDQRKFIQSELIRAAGLLKNKQVGLQVQADLRAGLKLTKFVPHPTITDQEIIASNLKPVAIALGINTDPKDPNSSALFQVNGQSYNPSQVPLQLTLGKAQAWTLRSVNNAPSASKAQHPFHIHVNPFQIVNIIDDATNAEVDINNPAYSQYAGMKGTWKDTIMLTPGVTIHTRTRYQRYIGEYVLHCHILDHEDQGMMANVEVVLPDGQGGIQAKGHH